MIDIKNLNKLEQIKLFNELEKALGWYSITTIDVDTLRERFEDLEETPSDAILHRACQYVSRKNEEENWHLLDWAQDVALEILTEEQTA
jgi:hypothetical protein